MKEGHQAGDWRIVKGLICKSGINKGLDDPEKISCDGSEPRHESEGWCWCWPGEEDLPSPAHGHNHGSGAVRL